MYNTTSFVLKKQDNPKLFEYFETVCRNSKNLYNVTNFYIRQVMTGIQKVPEERQPNEKEILDIVEKSIPKINQLSIDYQRKKINKCKNSKNKKDLENKLSKFVPKKMPTQKKWFLSYNLLDGILKVTDNVDYRALPAHVNQQTMKDCYENWKSFFESNKKYKKDKSGHTGKPNIPNYKKAEMYSSTFTKTVSQIIKDKNFSYITFPKTNATLCVGDYFNGKAKLQQVEVKPYYGFFKVFVTTKDETEYQPVECEPKRILGIDLGVNNFATISNNIGATPIIVKGGVMKSRNQYFNKCKAFLQSELPVGTYTSKRLKNLSYKRENFFNDYFYKISHSIVRYAVENSIDTIIVGKTKGWKLSIPQNNKKIKKDIRRQNNQTFVSIPFAKFQKILNYLCLKNSIQYIEIEESYTSKASFLDFDDIPTYDKENKDKYTFSGKRIQRGIYKSDNGTVLNADINGASNIIRKVKFNAFADMDLNYITKAEIWNFKNYYKSSSSGVVGGVLPLTVKTNHK